MNQRVNAPGDFRDIVALQEHQGRRAFHREAVPCTRRARLTTAGFKKAVMASFLKQFLQKFCRHEFSWPHSGVYGQDYQVCVRCGAIYEYDWGTMRRTRRLVPAQQGQKEIKSRP